MNPAFSFNDQDRLFMQLLDGLNAPCKAANSGWLSKPTLEIVLTTLAQRPVLLETLRKLVEARSPRQRQSASDSRGDST